MIPDETETADVRAVDDHRHHARAVACGSLLALASAVLYTATNVCLRSVVHCDAYWVSCLKAVPTLVIAALLVGVGALRGRSGMPGLGVQFWLFMTGLLAHVGGNVAFQWGLGVVGLAAAVPLTFSMILVCGALLGRFWLGEGITVRSAWALALLCLSMVLVGVHTEEARTTTSAASAPVADFDAAAKALAVAAIVLSGVAYAVLGAVIRRMVTGTAGMGATLLIISVAGIVCLGGASWWRLGTSGIAETSPPDLSIMLQGGLYNAVAFLLLTKALQLVPIVYVNVVNASQTAMAALAGVYMFDEPWTAALAVGIALMVTGIFLMERPRRRPSY